jgi:hypothetical protein
VNSLDNHPLNAPPANTKAEPISRPPSDRMKKPKEPTAEEKPSPTTGAMNGASNAARMKIAGLLSRIAPPNTSPHSRENRKKSKPGTRRLAISLIYSARSVLPDGTIR